jgi:hypothetical protein
MPLRNQASEFPNFVIGNWLFVIRLSPLPHSPGYSESYSPGYPESNSGDCPDGYSGSNSESCPDSYSESYPESNSESYSAGYPGRNPESCSENCGESCSEGSSPDCSGSCSEDSSGNNSEDYLPDCWENYSGSFDSRPACRETAGNQLLQLDDLGAEAGTGLDDIDAGRKRRAEIVPTVGSLVTWAKGESLPTRPVGIHHIQEPIRPRPFVDEADVD